MRSSKREGEMEKIDCQKCEKPFESNLSKNVFHVPEKVCGGFGATTIFSDVMIEVCDECLEKHGQPVDIYEGQVRFKSKLDFLLNPGLTK